MTTWPDPSDLELLGLSVEPGARRASFPLAPRVARPDGALYGGTAIAVSVAAMEAATGRPGLWVTTQFVSQAGLGDLIECDIDVHASGRNISQCQVTGRLGDRILFVSLGGTATPRVGGLEGQYESTPKVSGPGSGLPMFMGQRQEAPPPHLPGFHSVVEFRVAEALSDEESAPPMALWARLTNGARMTRAGISFLADMVPPAIARAAGVGGAGISLDNSLRFGTLPDDVEWVLLELRGHMSTGSHGHGSVRVWTEDGSLLAVGGQSANMRPAFAFDPEAARAMSQRES